MTNQEEIQNAIEWIEGLRNGWNAKDNIKYCNMAIKALEIWDNLFKSYEVLTKEITKSRDIKNATKRIDDFCIEQLRGIISDYYADLIIKEGE